jgi:hypothetical protein
VDLELFRCPIPFEHALAADWMDDNHRLNAGGERAWEIYRVHGVIPSRLAARAVTPQSPCFSPVWRSSLLEFLAGFGDIAVASLAVLAWALERLGELVGV